jgi:hypothetical protein
MSARPITAAARERIAKLMPRLASPFDGERAATAAAIDRVLIAEGLDWHDLTAAAIAAPGTPPALPQAERKHIPAAILDSMIHAIEHAPKGHSINARSRKFLADLRRLAGRYDPVSLSDRQLLWLQQLAERTGAP